MTNIDEALIKVEIYLFVLIASVTHYPHFIVTSVCKVEVVAERIKYSRAYTAF